MDRPATRRPRWPVAAASCVAVLVGSMGCGDNPFAFDWSDAPDTVLLYSLARPELNLESGFAFFQGVRVRIESPASTGTWDVAVDTRGGDIVLLPPRALGVAGAAARISTMEGVALEDVTRAPADTMAYVADQAVAVRMGTVYVVKTNRARGSFGTSCVYHAKLEPVVIDVSGGSLLFRYVTNPVCNSLDLIPPD